MPLDDNVRALVPCHSCCGGVYSFLWYNFKIWICLLYDYYCSTMSKINEKYKGNGKGKI